VASVYRFGRLLDPRHMLFFGCGWSLLTSFAAQAVIVGRSQPHEQMITQYTLGSTAARERRLDMGPA